MATVIAVERAALRLALAELRMPAGSKAMQTELKPTQMASSQRCPGDIWPKTRAGIPDTATAATPQTTRFLADWVAGRHHGQGGGQLCGVSARASRAVWNWPHCRVMASWEVAEVCSVTAMTAV
ncbi:MAG: hypothetical protein FWF71_07610 [Actinomycetia bacterium]|nr:hypothetical protein [Actinomycetes bacterium]